MKMNHNVMGVKPGDSNLKHFVYCAMDVWSNLYPMKTFGFRIRLSFIIHWWQCCTRASVETKHGLINCVYKKEEE
jgi:hypothetical protein